jgi:hypothetical protein
MVMLRYLTLLGQIVAIASLTVAQIFRTTEWIATKTSDSRK